jgi:hypothetical protein
MRDAVIIVAMAVIQNILFYCHPTTAHAPPIFARLFSLKAFIGVELSSGVYHAGTFASGFALFGLRYLIDCLPDMNLGIMQRVHFGVIFDQSQKEAFRLPQLPDNDL